jgi:biopolymer transport protein ExbB
MLARPADGGPREAHDGEFMVLANGNLIEQFSHAFEVLGAEWVLWLLIVLSVISVAVMIERAIFFAGHTMGDAAKVRDHLRKGELEAAVQAVASKKGLEAEVVRDAVRTAPLGAESVDAAVDATIRSEKLRYERFLSYLATLGSNAPFIALFGTVLGIVSAFRELAKNTASGTMTSGSSNIMSGISEALVATAVGLLVAIPAVAAYNVFSRWLKTIVARGEALKDSLLVHLKSLPAEPANDASPAPVSLPRAAGK